MVDFFVWRVNLGCIPTACSLLKRGVPVESPLYRQCLIENDDVDHALIRCSFAATIWHWIFKWCDILVPQLSNVVDLITFVDNWGNFQKKGTIFTSFVTSIMADLESKVRFGIQNNPHVPNQGGL